MTNSTPDAPRDVGGTHRRAGTEEICPEEGTAIPQHSRERPLRSIEEDFPRRLPASAGRERFAPNVFVHCGGRDPGRAAAHRGGPGRATTTARGEQAR
ncbi:hypothetical protein ACFORO_44915 [Amycolatopsis halotolerans]|uniref:Uncharacterized protein n=1 Tax=Amycolatopsis halotolerans TaxID=330083 RepID=A0ABV7QW12_9PSEU